MSETSLYPNAIDSTNIYEVVARLSTTLTADITAATTTIPLASTTGFPTQGYIVIDNETIKYISVSVGSVDATGGRGHAGTAAAHTSTTQVLVAVTAAVFNKLRAGLIAVQTHAGTSGGPAGFVNARYLGGSTESQLNSGYVGGKTSGQFLWAGSTAVDATLIGGISGGLLKENAIEFTPLAFDVNNDNPATLLTITGTSIAPKLDKVYFGNTNEADLPPFKMPNTYNGSSVTVNFLYCSSTASSVFDIGFKSAIAGNGEAYNPTFGTAVYVGAITCSGTTGLLGFTSKEIAGVSLGLTNSKLNMVRVLGGTTCSVQLMNLGITWNKG